MDSLNKQGLFDDSWMVLIAERLSAGQKVRYLKFRGVSMLPMLRQGKDSVELSPLSGKLKKYDLPVYLRSDGQYVMHRVVAVRESYYICLGDNTLNFETVYPEQMIGVVSAFKRGEKRIEVSDLRYRIYCCLWRPTRIIRVLWQKGKGLFCKLKSKIVKKLKDRVQ